MGTIINWRVLIGSIIVGVAAVSCAGTPDTTVTAEKPRQALQQIGKDSVLIHNAPEEIEKVRQALRAVLAAKKRGEDSASIKRRMLIADQRIRIARKAAQVKAARREMRERAAELRLLRAQLDEIERQSIASGLIEQTPEERARELIFFESNETRRGLVLRFKNIRFSSEGATLMSNAELPIGELADFLQLYPSRHILIEGHTDNTGSASFNQQLSQQRANVVRKALISRGVDPARIRAVGIGEEYPIASNDTEAGRLRNRRVDVVISDANGVIPERQY